MPLNQTSNSEQRISSLKSMIGASFRTFIQHVFKKPLGAYFPNSNFFANVYKTSINGLDIVNEQDDIRTRSEDHLKSRKLNLALRVINLLHFTYYTKYKNQAPNDNATNQYQCESQKCVYSNRLANLTN